MYSYYYISIKFIRKNIDNIKKSLKNIYNYKSYTENIRDITSMMEGIKSECKQIFSIIAKSEYDTIKHNALKNGGINDLEKAISNVLNEFDSFVSMMDAIVDKIRKCKIDTKKYSDFKARNQLIFLKDL